MNEIGGTSRIKAVDILRGAIMVLMAIDHVRVYSGLPAGGQEPGIFFTRWILSSGVAGSHIFTFTAGKSKNKGNGRSWTVCLQQFLERARLHGLLTAPCSQTGIPATGSPGSKLEAIQA